MTSIVNTLVNYCFPFYNRSMFEPKYTLTLEILEHIVAIERLYGQLEAMRLPAVLRLKLERDNLVKSSFISNSIEGNPLSLPEVTNLLLDDRVPANRDEKEIRNYFDLLRKLPALANQKFTVTAVTDLHRELMTGVDDEIAGKIRNERVVVGRYVLVNNKPQLKVKHEPPFHTRKEIVHHLEEFVTWWTMDEITLPLIRTGLFHHRYVHLHPFSDGNGRSCRLLTALLLVKSNYQINKYFVLDDYYDLDRQEYSDKLSSADKGDQTDWLEYFAAGMHYSLQSALAKARTEVRKLNIPLRPSPRENDVLSLLSIETQITTPRVAEHFGVSCQRAWKLLNGLVKKGLVKKIGSTKKSYYQLRG
jgi:Fic family protein